MDYSLSFSWETLAAVFGLMAGLPLLLSFGLEFLLKKQISRSSLVVVPSVVAGLLGFAVWQLWSSHVNISDGHLALNSGLYSEKIALSDIESIEFFPKGLPQSYELRWRTNGFGLPGYHAGYYSMDYQQPAFALMSKPPYVFLILKHSRQALVFSGSEALLQTLHQKSGAFLYQE